MNRGTEKNGEKQKRNWGGGEEELAEQKCRQQ